MCYSGCGKMFDQSSSREEEFTFGLQLERVQHVMVEMAHGRTAQCYGRIAVHMLTIASFNLRLETQTKETCLIPQASVEC